MDRGRVRFLVAIVVLAVPLSGCVADAAPVTGPLSILEAYRIALGDVEDIRGRPHLIGFVGHEGRPPEYLARIEGSPYLSDLLGPNVVQIETAGDEKGDGRSQVWSLLFATQDGKLLATTVTTDPVATETRWVRETEDAQLATLWAINMGGRFLVDSTEAMRSARAADPTFDARVSSGARVTYASDLVPLPNNGEHDLVHAIFVDVGDGEALLVAQVRHFTGDIVGIGAYDARKADKRVPLVEESFSLNPVVREGTAERHLNRTLSDVRLVLETVGTGRYTFRLDGPDGLIWETEGVRVSDNATEKGALGTLTPGDHRITATATGSIWFHLKMDGVVGL
ncbi:MAG: hypothetical protein KY455_13075 [Euryarchaeota archaeon]|nr:hypothetical protein [Euryarchaeota archaeon]